MLGVPVWEGGAGIGNHGIFNLNRILMKSSSSATTTTQHKSSNCDYTNEYRSSQSSIPSANIKQRAQLSISSVEYLQLPIVETEYIRRIINPNNSISTRGRNFQAQLLGCKLDIIDGFLAVSQLNFLRPSFTFGGSSSVVATTSTYVLLFLPDANSSVLWAGRK